MIKNNKFQCPICGNYTLNKKNECDICPVCNWEDDGSENYPDEIFGSNNISFNEAKELWNRNGYIEKFKTNIRRKPLGIELPKDSKEYLNIKKYIDNIEESYSDAINALLFEIEHPNINDYDFLEAKHKAFEILNALAFCDNKTGFKAASHLALCYAYGYGCKKNMFFAHMILKEVERRYKIK